MPMQDIIDVTVLAVVQGLTEFLPVSSSGHLVVAQRLLGVSDPGVRLEVWLHIGTLLSIFIFYRRSILNLLRDIYRGDTQARWMGWSLIVSALPAVIVYTLFHVKIDAVFESSRVTGALLMFTGTVLIASRWIHARCNEVSAPCALKIGLAQALAILPGVSRSGMTITAARACGVAPEKAAEFSFLMSIPLLCGAAVLDLLRVPPAQTGFSAWLLIFGALVGATVGYIAIKLLVRILRTGIFWVFGVYCIAVGVLVILLT